MTAESRARALAELEWLRARCDELPPDSAAREYAEMLFAALGVVGRWIFEESNRGHMGNLLFTPMIAADQIIEAITMVQETQQGGRRGDD